MAIFFSGTNQGLSRTTSLHDYNAAYTVAMWFYKTTSADDILYSNHEGSGNSDQMRVDASELWEVRANIGGTGPDVDDAFNISLNTWYFAALVRTSVTDLTAHLFSLAGAEISSPTATQDITGRTAQTTISVGHRGLNNDWTGRVHNIKVWGAALTVTELLLELYRTRPVRFTNLIAWYPTHNGSSTEHERDYFAGLNWTEDGAPTDADPPPISWGMPMPQVGKTIGVAEVAETGSAQFPIELEQLSTVEVDLGTKETGSAQYPIELEQRGAVELVPAGTATGGEVAEAFFTRPAIIPETLPDLQVKVFKYASTTEVFAPELRLAEVVRARSFYDPQGGGIFHSATIFVPRADPRSPWAIRDKMRVVLYWGLDVVWEGEIDEIGDNEPGDQPGNILLCLGFWGTLMDGSDTARKVDKPWVLTSVNEGVWATKTTVTAADLVTIRREGNAIRFIPKLEAWTSGQVARIELSVPTGQTIERVQFTFDLTHEGGNNFDAYLTNGSGTTIWSQLSATTGSQDLISSSEPFTPTQTIRFELRAAGGSDSTSTGSDLNYFDISSLIVSTEEGTIDAEQIGIDVVGLNDGLNSSITQIDSTLSLLAIPFDSNGMKTHGWILKKVSTYGTSSQQPIHFSLLESDRAGTPDGKPVLRMEPVPPLSNDPDYIISREGESEIRVPSIYRKGFGASGIMVTFTTPENLGYSIVTPTDDSNLEDSTKSTDFGDRFIIIDAGQAAQADAINTGRARLTEEVKPVFRMSQQIRAEGTLRNAAGVPIPVALVRPGKILQIDDYIDDRSDQSGKGLRLLITGTLLTNDGSTLSITASISDDQTLLILKQQQKLLLPTAAT